MAKRRRLGSYAEDALESQQMDVERAAYEGDCGKAATRLVSFRKTVASAEPSLRKTADRMLQNTEKYLAKRGCSIAKLNGMRRRKRRSGR